MVNFLVANHGIVNCINTAHEAVQNICTFQERLPNIIPEREQTDPAGQQTPISKIVPGNNQSSPNVIVIEDEDDVDESGGEYSGEDDEGSDNSFSNFHLYDNRDMQGTDSSSEYVNNFDEEDCVLMEPGPSRRHPPKRGRSKASPNSSSECEILEDGDGKVRQEWEEAALRRRSGSVFYNSRYKVESEGSTSASIYTENAVKIRKANLQDQDQEPPLSGSLEHVGLKKRKVCPVHVEDQDSSPGCPDGEKDFLDQVCSGEKSQSLQPTSFGAEEEGADADTESSSLLEGYHEFARRSTAHVEGGETFVRVHDDETSEERVIDQNNSSACCVQINDDNFSQREMVEDGRWQAHVILSRERLKGTEEFQHAQTEEWGRRQLELQRQAQEFQHERKRRRLEAERRMEMEGRQKQRLEEIRKSQKREEENLNHKEHVRERIQSELERITATCNDMATLLRCLGIPVDGGRCPSRQQVAAAYKKALLRFHPDRVSAMYRSDPLHQVEAEETFKLISRMKHTL